MDEIHKAYIVIGICVTLLTAMMAICIKSYKEYKEQLKKVNNPDDVSWIIARPVYMMIIGAIINIYCIIQELELIERLSGD